MKGQLMENHLTQREVAEMYYNCTAGHLNNVLAGQPGDQQGLCPDGGKSPWYPPMGLDENDAAPVPEDPPQQI
jgi:hypothetical protein